MRLSQHSTMRFQQRGFRREMLDLILAFGSETKRPGDVIELRITEKQKRQLVQCLDHITHKAILVNPAGDYVITVYNTN